MQNIKKVCAILFAVIAMPSIVLAIQNPNMVTNPGFENGMIGYSTTYSPYPGAYNSSGQAGVTTNPRLLQSNFLSFTGDGNFLVVNSSTNGNNEFICQDISVEQNQTYTFSVTSRSVFSSTASHAWYINGTAITGTINAPLGSWSTSTGTWSSGSATTARLCGKNMSRVYTGADFAIDNLVLQANAPSCTPHFSQKCVGNAVHWFNSCNIQEDIFVQCTADQTCANGACVDQHIQCSTNSQCGTNAYEGGLFCQGNSIYKNFRTYICANPGTASSTCSSSSSPKLQENCTANQTCNSATATCVNQNIRCNSASDCGANAYTGDPYCQNSNVYQSYLTWTCNNAGTSSSTCSSNAAPQLKTTCSGNQACNTASGSCANQNNNYTYHSYQQCIGNYLYWYDSLGTQQDSQYCQNGCYNNYCQNYNNNNNYYYSNCTYHAYKNCLGNSIYWYDSCGTQQDLVQSCYGINMVCKYGQCAYQQPYIPPYIPPVNPYIAHQKTACYSNNIYWFDSLGKVNTLYKNCADSNACTQDSCISGKCDNTLKCDGSTCATGSADYNNYCSNNNNNNNNQNNNNANALSISFLARENQTSGQWQKTVSIGANDTSYFMVSVVNNSGMQANNIIISANIPNEIASLGNLQIDGIQTAGDIVSGINIGALAPGAAKSITFEGKTQAILSASAKQAIATVSGQTDLVTINFNPAPSAAASVSSAQNTSGFWEFLKRWYLWILVGIVLIFLFVIVFRRLSSN